MIFSGRVDKWTSRQVDKLLAYKTLLTEIFIILNRTKHLYNDNKRSTRCSNW